MTSMYISNTHVMKEHRELSAVSGIRFVCHKFFISAKIVTQSKYW